MTQQPLFTEPAPRFPKRWQDCPEFLEALTRREYYAANGCLELLSEGAYLYMYELWQDGRTR